MDTYPGADAVIAARSDDVRNVRYFVIVMCVAGAVIPVLTLAFEPTSPAHTLGFSILAGAMALTAVMVWVVRPRRWLYEVLAQWGTLLIGGNIALMPTVGIMPVYLLWPIVLVAYIASLRVLVATYVWSMAVLVVAVTINPPSFGLSDVLIGMGATLAVMSGIVWVVTQRQTRLRLELEIAARTDPLTSLLNRRAFLPWLAVAIEHSRAGHEPFSVVMLDLDHFKSINDGIGHLGGDEVLVEVARVMRAQSRGGDVLCRFGGEEFAVGLPGATTEDALAYATRVAAALATTTVHDGLVLTTSAGVCGIGPEASVESLLRGADEALYAAKAAGRNRAAVWDGAVVVLPAFDHTA